MHLQIDAPLPAAAALAKLLSACRARGLTVAATQEAPRGPSGRASFTVELADPFPQLPSDATASAAQRDVYPISVFDTDPGRCRVATLPPTAFLDLLGHPELAPAAAAFERILRGLLDEVGGLAKPA